MLRSGVLGMALLVLAARPALAWPQAVSDALAVTDGAHFLVGELARIDLVRRALAVKPDGEKGEIEIGVTAETRLTSGGRAIRMEDLRGGDRVAVSCSDAREGEHVARMVAVRGPARRPSPAPSPTPPSKS
ncbi:MAG TPA: hypothetical protein VII13_20195 [Vicinamibacteria bacterium]|jgi:hypothetical protein